MDKIVVTDRVRESAPKLVIKDVTELVAFLRARPDPPADVIGKLRSEWAEEEVRISDARRAHVHQTRAIEELIMNLACGGENLGQDSSGSYEAVIETE